MKQFAILTLCLVLILATACTTKQERISWHEIEQLISISPDSAYRFLKDLEPGDWNDRDKNLAVVYKIDSKNKAFIHLDEDDYGDIQNATEYFKKQNGPSLFAKCLYLKGSVCRDLSDYPQAVDCFMEALEQLNITDTIHYSELSISIWGQMADIYKSQYMTDKSKDIEQRIIRYYKSVNQQKGALDFEFSSLIGSYKEKNYVDVAKRITDIYNRYLELGDTINAARSLKIGILANINLRRWEEANRQLREYENKSRSVSEQGYASAGNELYYYMKGMCLLHEHQFDSAETFFRRELSPNANWNNREAAYSGLSELFLMTNQKDSALTYLQLKSIAVDSNYQNRISERIQQFASFYDYSLQKNEKEKQSRRAEQLRNQLKNTLLLSVLLITIVCSVLVLLFNRKRNRMKLEAERHERLNERRIMEKEREIENHQHRIETMNMELSTMKKDIEGMQRELTEQYSIINKKNNDLSINQQLIYRMQETISELKIRLANSLEEIDKKKDEIRNCEKEIDVLKEEKQLLQRINDNTINHNTIISYIKKAIENEKNLKPSEWKEIQFFCENEKPQFFERIMERISNLTETELHFCLLELLEIPTSEISVLLHQTTSSVTNLRKRLYMKAEKKKIATSDDARKWLKRMKK